MSGFHSCWPFSSFSSLSSWTMPPKTCYVGRLGKQANSGVTPEVVKVYLMWTVIDCFFSNSLNITFECDRGKINGFERDRQNKLI